jgi:nitrate/TMAO reductase-like tetraheme cytochrome c subunit
MTDTSDNTPTEQPEVAHDQPAVDATPKRSPRRWILWAVLAVVLLVFAIPVAFTATSGACASCHEMKPYYDSWHASSHREAASNCLYCHARPGVLGVLGYELGFYGEIVGHFTGAKVLSNSGNTPDVASCARTACHSLNRETSNSGDIKINHRLHVVQQGIPCPRCHPGAVHAGVNGRLKLPPMTLCKQCHADKMTQCTYCHTEKRLGTAPGH